MGLNETFHLRKLSSTLKTALKPIKQLLEHFLYNQDKITQIADIDLVFTFSQTFNNNNKLIISSLSRTEIITCNLWATSGCLSTLNFFWSRSPCVFLCSGLLGHLNTHSRGAGCHQWVLYWLNAGTSNPLRRDCSTPLAEKKRRSIFAGHSATASLTPPGTLEGKEISAELCSRETVTRYGG